MNKSDKIFGFTLIELMVVISIMGIVLLFSLPLFKNLNLFSNDVSQVGNMVRLINDLKTRAIKKNMDMILHMDSGSGMLWVTDESMDEQAQKTAKENSVSISNTIEILDVEFFKNKESGTREYLIRFNHLGYCDFALIHMLVNEKDITLKIEPFLPQIQVLDTHVYFEDCI